MTKTTAKSITAALQRDIATGTLVPGDRLDEASIATRFGTSRTPVREAITRLASTGFAVHRPNRGAIVAKLSLSELIEMFEMMAELEATCGRLAAQRASDAQLQDMQAKHEACAKFAEQGNAEHYYTANVVFHEAIYAASGNTYLANETRQLRNRLAPYRRLQLNRRNRPEESYKEHDAIVVAISAGEADTAAALLRAHVAKQSGSFNDFVASLPKDLVNESAA
ncbi:MAG: GntR family transcriptional regulator [Hyphomicrobiales bacterium]